MKTIKYRYLGKEIELNEDQFIDKWLGTTFEYAPWCGNILSYQDYLDLQDKVKAGAKKSFDSEWDKQNKSQVKTS